MLIVDLGPVLRWTVHIGVSAVSSFRLSERSLQRLDGVHPDIIKVVKLAIQRTETDFTVVEGVRTLSRQKELVAARKSQTMNSLHLPQADGYSHAVDLAPLVNGQVPWNDWRAFEALAGVMKACAVDLGVPIEWGGDWKSFKDGPHFQLPRDWSGARAAT